jgi:hypothetical protein
MLDKIKAKIYKVSKAAGAEVILLPDNKYRVVLTLLSLEKNAVVVEKKEQLEEGSIEIIKNILKGDIPLSIVFTGRGILHKKISDSGTDNNSLIQSVLPNAKAQDFYIQTIVSEKSSLISIIRKELVDPFLELIEKAGVYSTAASLGAGVVTSVYPLLPQTSDSKIISWPGHTLEFDQKNTIVDYKTQGEPDKKYFQIDSEKLESAYLISYAAAFSLLAGLDTEGLSVDKVMQNKEEFLNKQLFQKLGWVVLGLFLTVLMINFLLFSSYSSRNNELTQKESKYKSMFSEMEKLGKDVKEKETFLSGAGWLQSSSTTYFADRIAASVPGSVRLTELSVNPLDERKSKEVKKEMFSNGLIVLRGDCTRPTELNEWLDKIKSIDKIVKAKLVQYVYDNKDNKGTFSIEIEINN